VALLEQVATAWENNKKISIVSGKKHSINDNKYHVHVLCTCTQTIVVMTVMMKVMVMTENLKVSLCIYCLISKGTVSQVY
jgi:hypothetical protein